MRLSCGALSTRCSRSSRSNRRTAWLKIGGETVNLGALLLNLVLLGIVAYIVLRPLLSRARPYETPANPTDGLLEAREHLLDALRELELDHAAGKVTAADYAQQRPQLMAQGAAVLRQLDAVAGKSSHTHTRRQAAAHVSVDDEIEAAVSQVRRGRGQKKSSVLCPACHQAAPPTDRFCSHCGSTLIKSDRQPEAQR
jgi:hypothetical protein